MRKILKIQLTLLLVSVITIFAFLFIVILAVCGYKIAYIEEQTSQMRANTTVINNQIYAERYRQLLNKYLISKGYVSLERMVFYLQRTKNVLDTSTLSDEEWDQAYLDNINEKEKQMVPIKTICKNLKEDSNLPPFTIENGVNEDGLGIDVIDLCIKDGVDITESDDYTEDYYSLPFIFPLKKNFTVTSIVFEYRNIQFGMSKQEQERVNFHSGWDLAVPIGTNFYSICDGTISDITNTQANDLNYEHSGNATGNSMTVACDNGYVAMYLHLQYKSQAYGLKVGSFVKKGDLLGRTSTTGTSTGPHLHLGLKNKEGTLVDALAYIDFTK